LSFDGKFFVQFDEDMLMNVGWHKISFGNAQPSTNTEDPFTVGFSHMGRHLNLG